MENRRTILPWRGGARERSAESESRREEEIWEDACVAYAMAASAAFYNIEGRSSLSQLLRPIQIVAYMVDKQFNGGRLAGRSIRSGFT